MLNRIKTNLGNVSNKLSSYVFTEVDCPVYIINNSADINDYYLVFDFSLVVKTMKKSRLPKPLITVWAGRNDYDQDLLSKNIKNAFVEQFNEAKKEAKNNDLAEKMENTDSRDSGISFSISALVAMLFIANPVVDLLLLFFALTAGKEATIAQINLLKNEFKKFTGGDTSGRETLNDYQEQNIIDAIKALEIKIQKDLYLHAFSFSNDIGSLTGVDYKHVLPSFIKL